MVAGRPHVLLIKGSEDEEKGDKKKQGKQSDKNYHLSVNRGK